MILRERYKLNHVIGTGGMGSVYQAEDLRLPGRLCAIKEVQFDAHMPAKMRQQLQAQFLQEASILAQLDHPNLPKVSDYFNEGEHDYLVMDFVPGQDLNEILQSKLEKGELLDEKIVINWAYQLIDALVYLHHQSPPVLHRDIKPHNIKRTPTNQIKLVDFGLVKVMAADDAQTITVVQGRGTALYTPLEQYGGESEHTDVRSDIYAFGATFYHLLTGQKPPSAKERFLHPTLLRPPRECNPRITKTVSDALMWALSMHPNERPNSLLLLKQVMLGKNPSPQFPTPPQQPSPWLLAFNANKASLFITLGLFLLAIIATLSR